MSLYNVMSEHSGKAQKNSDLTIMTTIIHWPFHNKSAVHEMVDATADACTRESCEK